MAYQNRWLDNFWRQTGPQPLAGRQQDGGAANMMAGASPNALAQPQALFGGKRRPQMALKPGQGIQPNPVRPWNMPQAPQAPKPGQGISPNPVRPWHMPQQQSGMATAPRPVAAGQRMKSF